MTKQQLFEIRMHYLWKSICAMMGAFAKALPLAILIGIITKYVVGYVKKNKHVTIHICKERAIIIFAVYIAIMAQMTVLFREIGSGYIIDIVPFNTPGGTNQIVLYAVANMVAFLPTGILCPMLWSRINHWGKIVCVGFLGSLLIEVLQLILQCGEFQIEDLLMNSVGTITGYIIYKKWNARRDSKQRMSD